MTRPIECSIRFLGKLVSAGILTLLLSPLGSGSAQENPIEEIENSNALLQRFADRLTCTASSQFSGYPPGRAIDGKKSTSWFTAVEDTAAHGKTPWLAVTFPADVTISRITVWGNRESSWPTGYSVLRSRLELFDAAGKRIYSAEEDGWGEAFDFDFVMHQPVADVRQVRLVSLKDQGDQNGSRDIAFGEIEIE